MDEQITPRTSSQEQPIINGLPTAEELFNPTQTETTLQGTEQVNGLDKCPKCGSAEIQLRSSTGRLTCQFCRHEWEPILATDTLNLNTPIHELQGTVIGSGAGKIDREFDHAVTLKCGACGAEVVVSTDTSTQARCHWCRQNLSINQQIPNGAVPDAVLPFKLTKDEAIESIRKFAGDRRFFARKQFKEEFVPENVMGVYLPYMVIDGNLYGEVHGKGEIQTRTWTEEEGRGDNKRTVRYYAADIYSVSRRLDYTVDDLQVEGASSKISHKDRRNTNNIINSILPFDTKNAVEFNSNYLNGFTSEKRDLDVEDLKPHVTDQFLSIARSEVSGTLRKFDRGVRWEQEGVDVKGSRWVSMYLPVWLYSYYEQDKDVLHYIAVNARTGETMGSVPINYPLLFGLATLVGTVVEIPLIGITLATLAG